MTKKYSQAKLEAYLDELLPGAEAIALEDELRSDKNLKEQLTEINDRRDAGIHSLGEIWRRNRLSCPTREQLGGYLLGILSPEEADFVSFHVETSKCRYCSASVEDLRAQQAAGADEDSKHRQKKYFETSAGYLRGKS